MKPVSPDAAEQIKRLAQPVSAVVLPYDHVITATGCHKDDGGHICDYRQEEVYYHQTHIFRIVHPKNEMMSSFSHTHVIQNIYFI